MRQDGPIEPGTLVSVKIAYSKPGDDCRIGTVTDWQYPIVGDRSSKVIIYKIFTDCRIIEFLSPVWTITPLDEACVVS